MLTGRAWLHPLRNSWWKWFWNSYKNKNNKNYSRRRSATCKWLRAWLWYVKLCKRIYTWNSINMVFFLLMMNLKKSQVEILKTWISHESINQSTNRRSTKSNCSRNPTQCSRWVHQKLNRSMWCNRYMIRKRFFFLRESVLLCVQSLWFFLTWINLISPAMDHTSEDRNPEISFRSGWWIWIPVSPLNYIHLWMSVFRITVSIQNSAIKKKDGHYRLEEYLIKSLSMKSSLADDWTQLKCNSENLWRLISRVQSWISLNVKFSNEIHSSIIRRPKILMRMLSSSKSHLKLSFNSPFPTPMINPNTTQSSHFQDHSDLWIFFFLLLLLLHVISLEDLSVKIQTSVHILEFGSSIKGIPWPRRVNQLMPNGLWWPASVLWPQNVSRLMCFIIRRWSIQNWSSGRPGGCLGFFFSLSFRLSLTIYRTSQSLVVP